MRASRALAPVYYTSGDRFAHDPALPLPAWPVLDPLRKLAKIAPNTDSARFLTVSAKRGRNRLAHALREAIEALSDATTLRKRLTPVATVSHLMVAISCLLTTQHRDTA